MLKKNICKYTICFSFYVTNSFETYICFQDMEQTWSVLIGIPQRVWWCPAAKTASNLSNFGTQRLDKVWQHCKLVWWQKSIFVSVFSSQEFKVSKDILRFNKQSSDASWLSNNFTQNSFLYSLLQPVYTLLNKWSFVGLSLVCISPSSSCS